MLEDVDRPGEERETMFAELDGYMDAQIEDHIARPRDDLTSFLLDAEIGGSKLTKEHIRGTMILLMIAGIDTTWSAIGASLWHLARHPDDRRRLASGPGLMGAAVEELLRPLGRHLVRWPGPRTAHASRQNPLATRALARRVTPGRLETWHAGHVEEEPPHRVEEEPPHHVQEEPPPQGRLARLWRAAERRNVPLRTIVVTVAVVAATYLAGKLIYRLRDIVLLMLVAGFVALLLNPIVVLLQRRLFPRRGVAVAIVTILAALVFGGLAVAFGYPLVNGITHLADELPTYVANAQHGRGWIGHLVTKYHIQTWVQRNAPKLVSYAQSLSKPALTIGKGALSLVIELATIFILVLLLLLEGPKMRRWVLGQMVQARAAAVTRVAADVNTAVTGYMLGNLLTSLIAGIVVFVTLMIVGVPFPFLWGLWVALVDFLPMIGGALAGIPTVLFAFGHGVTAGVVTLVVFLVYTQVENHVLNPVIMSKTVRISPLLVLIAVLVGASLGSLVGGLFGGFVAALLAIPAAGALQVLVKEVWQATAPTQDPPAQVPPPQPTKPEDTVKPQGELFPVPPDTREHGS
ncbi:MAG: AI-2E family transporter [Streptosporangiaceae bacterium]